MAITTSPATWHQVLTEQPELPLRFALSICSKVGVPATHRIEIAYEAAQETAVSLLSRPIGEVEEPMPYVYAVVRSEITRAQKRLMPQKAKRTGPDALRDLSAPVPAEPVAGPDLAAVLEACGPSYFRYLEAEMDMPDADAATKAARVGVTTDSYRVGLCRARGRCRRVAVGQRHDNP